MEHTTSLEPGDTWPADQRKTRATTEGVDAQNANEFDIEHGLAGVEAKPFSPAAADSPKTSHARDDDRRTRTGVETEGLVSERRNPGRDDGVNASTADRDAGEG